MSTNERQEQVKAFGALVAKKASDEYLVQKFLNKNFPQSNPNEVTAEELLAEFGSEKVLSWVKRS